MHMKKLYHDDCLNVLPTLKDNSIDMILCDLPYGQTRHKWDVQLDLEKLWKEYKRICKPNAAICLFAQHQFLHSPVPLLQHLQLLQSLSQSRMNLV